MFGQWWWAAWIMLICNMVLPMSLFSQKLRRNTTWLFILSIFINIGMWFERFVIVVPSLSHEFEPWQWGGYTPTWVDIGILIGSFGWFFMWFLLFIRQLPVMAIAEIKEIVPPRYGHGAMPHDIDVASGTSTLRARRRRGSTTDAGRHRQHSPSSTRPCTRSRSCARRASATSPCSRRRPATSSRRRSSRPPSASAASRSSAACSA